MKKIYSVGYTDSYNDFTKLKDEKGNTKKFATIEEAEEYVKNNLNIKSYMIMQGWIVIKKVN